MDRDEQILETRRQEASLLFDAHQAGLATADRVMALALTLIGAAVAVGFDKNHREIFLVLPLGFALLLTYQLHVYADVKVMGVYRRHLEHAINKSLDERVLAYESGVAPTRHGSYSFSVTFSGWVYILIVMAVTIYGGYICHELYIHLTPPTKQASLNTSCANLWPLYRCRLSDLSASGQRRGKIPLIGYRGS